MPDTQFLYWGEQGSAAELRRAAEEVLPALLIEP
jgi:hypothetical protein